ncbi:MAG: WYL domain-containing protein, partial [Acidimicrobiia bacterium]|nr:WYL domain-containing protein [Acidimicrobiia bacterium]
PTASLSDGDGGALVAEVLVRNRDAFIGWLLGFDDHAELLGPDDLRLELLDRVRGAR